MSNPLFNIGDVVYLVESAKIGSIESYEVSGVRQDVDSQWLYQVSIPQRPPNSTATFGDRITLRHSCDFELRESDLTTYCVAIDLALATARSIVTNLTALKNTYCSEGSGSGSGSGSV